MAQGDAGRGKRNEGETASASKLTSRSPASKLAAAMASVSEAARRAQVEARADGRELPLLSERLRDIDTPAGRARVEAFLASTPYPHFSAAPGRPGLIVRIEKDGTRTVGRFVRRTWVPEPPERP